MLPHPYGKGTSNGQPKYSLVLDSIEAVAARSFTNLDVLKLQTLSTRTVTES